jgi:glycerol-3-phosphate dehydrogenase
VILEGPGNDQHTLAPPLIVNATGAWGDFTLRELHVPAPPLFGGTKGSHIVTWNASLVRALHGHGVYAEADDGRLVFVLPFGDAVLIGTTDERFELPPDQAIAAEHEIAYLIGMVNELFPQSPLTREDVTVHCCGVRPLPRAEAGSTAAISRDHDIVEHRAGTTPVLTLVGGKLTTCRAFGETVADEVLNRLDAIRTAGTRDRIVPGGEEYPATPDELADRIEVIARRHGLTPDQVRAGWNLLGTETERILETSRDGLLDDTLLPLSIVRWIIANEWVQTLDDLVERRLMLVFEHRLTMRTLRALAGLLVEARLLDVAKVDAAVEACLERLRVHYGRAVEGSPLTP